MAENREEVDTTTYLLVEAFRLLKKIVIQWAPKTVIKTPLHNQADELIKDIDEYLTFPSDKS